MQLLVGSGMRSKLAMNIVLRIMTNLLRDDAPRVPELAVRAASALLKRLPKPKATSGPVVS
jgi:hypothetical protein